MKDSSFAIFTDGSSLINPEPTGAGAVILRAGMNKPPSKLAKAVSSNSTNYHGEIDAILALKHILSAQPHFSANTIHMFRDSIVTINVITCLPPEEVHHGKIEEIIHIQQLTEMFFF